MAVSHRKRSRGFVSIFRGETVQAELNLLQEARKIGYQYARFRSYAVDGYKLGSSAPLGPDRRKIGPLRR
jgi:hypothetical protein